MATQTKPLPTPTPTSDPVLILIINATDFFCAQQSPGVQCLALSISDSAISSKSISVSQEPPDLSHDPEEYHDFTDVFSKGKADTLPPRRPYDLKIEIEEGTTPLIGPMYSLSQSKLVTL